MPNPYYNRRYAPKKHRDWIEKIAIGLSGATLVIAICAAVFAGLAARFTYGQWQTASDTEKRQLRAFVFIDGASVILDGRTLRGAAEIKNSGQTPAYDVIIEARLRANPSGQSPNLSNSNLQSVERSRGILPPGGRLTWQSEVDVPVIDTATIPALQNSPNLVSVMGQTEYSDAFGRIWCLTLHLRGGRYTNGVWALKLTEDGNQEHEGKCADLSNP